MSSYVQAHLDLLLLAMIRQEPRDVNSVNRELRERFGAKSTPSGSGSTLCCTTWSATGSFGRSRPIPAAIC